MPYEFKLPDLGEGLTEGEIGRWLVSEGQEIAEDDPLVEISTDKTTVEIPSPASGTVLRILVGEGDVVAVGTVLVVIGENGAGPNESPVLATAAPGETSMRDSSAAEPVERGRVRATPLVRRLAQELGVDLAAISATGAGGRVTEQDVRTAASSASTAQPATGNAEGRREPLRGIRRVISEHMTRAHREIPPVTWVEECDFTALDQRRGELSYVPFVLRAVALALQEFPELNARLDGDAIVYLTRYDLGLAVQTDAGLVVPVVRGCDTATVAQIADEAKRLADAARDGTLKPEELRGSTFTVTSAGKLSGLFQTPIVNHPEVGILGIGRVGTRAVVRGGEVVVRNVGHLTVTFDHRVVDGARAAAFGLSVIGLLEGGSL
jgi:pyruvate dehydrogenase E2 component (dihydrolipoamide acetyltransferase)